MSTQDTKVSGSDNRFLVRVNSAEHLLSDLRVFGPQVNAAFPERLHNSFDTNLEQGHTCSQLAAKLQRSLRRTVSALNSFGSSLESDLQPVCNGCVHNSSLTGYGADPVSAPAATTEAATSVVGDIVRDGTDKAPGALTPVEESSATGAAASSQRPHPNPLTESGSDQR